MQVAREYRNTTKSVMTPPHTPANCRITFWMVAACLSSLAKARITSVRRDMTARACSKGRQRRKDNWRDDKGVNAINAAKLSNT